MKRYIIDKIDEPKEPEEPVEDVEDVEEKNFGDVAQARLGLTLSPNTIRIFAEAAETKGATFARRKDQYMYWDKQSDVAVDIVLSKLADQVEAAKNRK